MIGDGLFCCDIKSLILLLIILESLLIELVFKLGDEFIFGDNKLVSKSIF